MTTDRERLVALLTALDASQRCLERPVCRGWVGDWQITGKHGHAVSDGTGYLLYAHATPRRWTSIKQSLAFCKMSQDADDEGILRLDACRMKPRPRRSGALWGSESADACPQIRLSALDLY